MKHERNWYIESTPTTSALDQWGLLVQSRLPSTDDTLAGFKQTIVPHLDAAYKLARFLSKDADAAKDIVQEAFLRAYRSFAGYRGENAHAWISKIVHNCYYGWLASRRRKSRLEVDSHAFGYTEELVLSVPSDECNPEAMLGRDGETRAVRSILNAMSPTLRKILMLREFEELSYRQISEITALPIGTVMSRLARARKAFADAWQRETKKSC